MTDMKLFGARVQRKEDPELLTGKGRYVGDIQLPGMLQAAFVRSPHPHARVRSFDTQKASELAGVHAVYTLEDMPARLWEATLPVPVPTEGIIQLFTQHALAKEEVCFAGEAVAVVVAESRYVAEDAAELVNVDYELLPAAGNCKASLAPDAPRAHTGSEDNVAAFLPIGYGDVDEAFSNAAHVFQESLFIHRGGGHAMECRGVLASHDPAQDLLTVWSATQRPHGVKAMLVDLLEMGEHQVRVVAPDVGGGFGPKGMSYPEEVVVSACAMMLGRPVKWLEDRRESYTTTTQDRDQYWDIEIAVDSDGSIRGVRGTLTHDAGAYLPWSFILPFSSAITMPGPYVIPNYQLDITVVLTNKTPTTPVRGAGRPQAVFAMERLMDRVANELKLDPAEARRRNFIRSDQMPFQPAPSYHGGIPLAPYDSGDYHALQKKTLEAADYAAFSERRAEARKEGRYVGIGVASCVEGTGYGPFEGSDVRITPSGKVLVYTGSSPQGHSHKTTLAQVCADQLGVDIDDITVVTGDTAAISMGMGTFGSRSAVTAGSATYLAAKRVREKVLETASQLLEAAPGDLELDDGRVYVKGTTSSGFALGELSRITEGMPGASLPDGLEPGLEETQHFSPSQPTFASGCHVVEVEVDVETGEVRLLRYTVGHDCGRMINPLVVDGQILGGVAHGIGNTLYEEMRYDEDANPLTSTMFDYLLPVASSVPSIDVGHLETPSPLNPLGVKGTGEGGAIPVNAAVVAAIEDALEPFGVRLTTSPVMPQKIVELLEGANMSH